MRKKNRTFDAGFLDPALEAGLVETGLAEAALELGLALEAGLDAGLTTSVSGSVVAAAATWDSGLDGGALAFDAGLAYEVKHQMSQKC